MKLIRGGEPEIVMAADEAPAERTQRRVYAWVLSLTAAAFFALSVWFSSQPETSMVCALIGWLCVGGAVRVHRKGADHAAR